MKKTLQETIETYGEQVAQYVRGELDQASRKALEDTAEADEMVKNLLEAELRLASEPNPQDLSGEEVAAMWKICQAMLSPEKTLAAFISADYSDPEKDEIVHGIVEMYVMGDEESYISLMESTHNADLNAHRVLRHYAKETRRRLVEVMEEGELPLPPLHFIMPASPALAMATSGELAVKTHGPADENFLVHIEASGLDVTHQQDDKNTLITMELPEVARGVQTYRATGTVVIDGKSSEVDIQSTVQEGKRKVAFSIPHGSRPSQLRLTIRPVDQHRP